MINETQDLAPSKFGLVRLQDEVDQVNIKTREEDPNDVNMARWKRQF
jgi:hypothetical protein